MVSKAQIHPGSLTWQMGKKSFCHSELQILKTLFETIALCVEAEGKANNKVFWVPHLDLLPPPSGFLLFVLVLVSKVPGVRSYIKWSLPSAPHNT